MFRNPEFIRNTWTELTLKKLAAMPLILVTVYLLTYSFAKDLPFFFLPSMCIFCYGIFTYIWGTRLAAETVIKEINSNTWSFQTLTSMSPLTMAVGKLFGSTAYIWYGNFICFALYILSFHIAPDNTVLPPDETIYGNILLFAVLGLAAHVLPLLLALDSIRWRHFFEKFDVTFFQFAGMAMLVPLYNVIRYDDTNMPICFWYGQAYSLKTLTIIFAAIFIVWGFTAIVNQIKNEFGQEPYPVSWFLFTLSLALVLFGFNNYAANNPVVCFSGTLWAFFAVLCITYLTLCGESNMALRPHMVLKYYRTGQYKRLFMIMPRSLITIPLIIALAVILSTEFSRFGQGESDSINFIVWAMILFMLRDFCFIYLWSLFAQGHEKATTVVPVMITLATYTIIPTILAHTDLNIFCSVFMPFFYENAYLSYNESAVWAIMPPLFEFLIMLTLLVFGLRKKFRGLDI